MNISRNTPRSTGAGVIATTKMILSMKGNDR